MKKRFIVEFGTGADLHGGDCSKAAVLALHDAMHHSCLCGISEICEAVPSQMSLEIKIAAPGEVDPDAVKESLPGGGSNAEIEIVSGGLRVRGLHVEEYGQGDHIVIVNAAITVYIDE